MTRQCGQTPRPSHTPNTAPRRDLCWSPRSQLRTPDADEAGANARFRTLSDIGLQPTSNLIPGGPGPRQIGHVALTALRSWIKSGHS